MKLRWWFHPLRWVAGAESARGVRQENQDNFLWVDRSGVARSLIDELPRQQTLEGWRPGFVRLAVADGMGGHRDGRAIAEALIEELTTLPAGLSPKKLREALFSVHQHLYERFDGGHEDSPGTTLVMADVRVRSGRAVIATIGDSRVLLWRKGAWRCLTHDHIVGEFDWRSGEVDDNGLQLAQEEAGHHIAQAMGSGSFGLIADSYGYRPMRASHLLRLDLARDLPSWARQHADLFEFKLHPGDLLLLASDGLWSEPYDTLPEPPPTMSEEDQMIYLRELIEAAITTRGGLDNVTLALLRCADD